MGRVPCCEKMGLKKGPWTPEEDQILVSYIQQHGHGNWRALPKLAGLLRCGKSCRLRWINYLRPDIKRGNFSIEEEETIIKLHQILGNRWSAIASKLPGRTDNEVKNYWHTRIKKRVQENCSTPISKNRTGAGDHNTIQPRMEMININTKSISEPVVNFSVRGHAPLLQQEPYAHQDHQSLCSAISSDQEAINVLSNVNDMDFWYDLFLKAGNSK